MTRNLVTWRLIGVVMVVVMGVVVPATGRGRETILCVDDFEDGDHIAATGSAWLGMGDDLVGGKTSLRLEMIQGGAHGSRGALRLSGTLGEGPGAFAYALAPVLQGTRPADLGQLTAIRLQLRSAADVLVGFGGKASATNFMARVPASRHWTSVTVPFTSLQPQGKGHEKDPWDQHNAFWVGFGVAAVQGASGHFSIDVDDIALVGPPGAGAPGPEPGAAPRTRGLTPDDPSPLAGLKWRELAQDPAGDGRPGLPDARAVFTARDRSLVWFRIDLQDTVPPNWFGVNLALDVDGDPANGTAWWGKNKAFHFDRLVSAWLWDVDGRYEGTVGIASSEEVAARKMTNDQEVHFATDRTDHRIYVGVPAAAVAPAGTTASAATHLVVAVGSAISHSDDVPDEGFLTVGLD